jgi:fluoroacetyl-CoA thioesterase
MQAELQPGLVGEASIAVDATNLATAFGSGAIDVFATPALVALLEQAASLAVEPLLAAGMITVGTHVDVRHLAATAAGDTVRARAELVEVDRRRLVFRVEAFDSVEQVGEGTHERMIVDRARLLERANAKHAHSGR